MIILLSPAKSLDYQTPPTTAEYTQPAFLAQSEALIQRLRELSPAEIASLMKLSDPLASLNATRYAEWSLPFTPDNAKQAVLAFNGDVYEGLDAPSLKVDDLRFAQQHVRILSGLYGLLRPLDLMQPYRLEMGTKLPNAGGKDLYAFWGERLAGAVNAAAAEGGAGAILNLASEEYFKATRRGKLALPVIQPVFEDWSGGRHKVVSFYAKRARGLMSRFVIENRLTSPKGLRDFDREGYAFVAAASDESTLMFRRRREG